MTIKKKAAFVSLGFFCLWLVILIEKDFLSQQSALLSDKVSVYIITGTLLFLSMISICYLNKRNFIEKFSKGVKKDNIPNRGPMSFTLETVISYKNGVLVAVFPKIHTTK